MYTDQEMRTMRLIEREIGCKFEQIGLPAVKDVMRASNDQVTHLIKHVNPDLAKEFLQTAESLLEEQGPDAFAAALAHMSGFSQLPPSRSLLTHEPVCHSIPFLAFSS
jgi:ATP-dependent RNA helicase DDX21